MICSHTHSPFPHPLLLHTLATSRLRPDPTQALFKLSVEFRKEETRFLNKVEAQKGLTQGSSIGVVEGAEGR